MAGDVAAIAVRGRWLKHTYPGSLALPVREPPPDNRWQRGSVVDAVYLADSKATVWAEWYRHLAERAIPPLAQMPRDLWAWDVDVKVVDLSTPDRLAGLGPDGGVLCLFRDSDGVRGAKPSGSPQRVTEPPPPPTGLRT